MILPYVIRGWLCDDGLWNGMEWTDSEESGYWHREYLHGASSG